jgi:hypothetical protein
MAAPLDIAGQLFCVTHFKVFQNSQDKLMVACFGHPSTVADHWIINIPAPEVFTDCTSFTLPTETKIPSIWAHSECPVNPSFLKYLTDQIPSISWHDQVSALGFPEYDLADLFRDLAIASRDDANFTLAYTFIDKALELRPEGPVITQMHKNLKGKIHSSQ